VETVKIIVMEEEDVRKEERGRRKYIYIEIMGNK
jgi:hypothetical protein